MGKCKQGIRAHRKVALSVPCWPMCLCTMRLTNGWCVRWDFRRHSTLGLRALCEHWNPKIRGWMNYYAAPGRYGFKLHDVLQHFDFRLALAQAERALFGQRFALWICQNFAPAKTPSIPICSLVWPCFGTGRMTGDCHVRFCESARGQFLRATRRGRPAPSPCRYRTAPCETSVAGR
jgi:hypothetical protein